MTIGIYSLYWEEQDLIYIGQSQNIEKRKHWHLSNLRNGKHTNFKVQNAYNLYGEPTFNLLEFCTFSRLNALEIIYTEEFDSISSGLNIINAGTSTGYGYTCSSSKYTREQLIEVLNRLALSLDTHLVISKDLNVGLGTIDSISTKSQHTWLAEEFPDKYAQMQNNRSLRKGVNNSGTYYEKYGKNVSFVSPEGVVYSTDNLLKFCKSNDFFSKNCYASQKGLSRLAHKTAKSYKGWKLYE